jgi:hypothetical protein
VIASLGFLCYGNRRCSKLDRRRSIAASIGRHQNIIAQFRRPQLRQPLDLGIVVMSCRGYMSRRGYAGIFVTVGCVVTVLLPAPFGPPKRLSKSRLSAASIGVELFTGTGGFDRFGQIFLRENDHPGPSGHFAALSRLSCERPTRTVRVVIRNDDNIGRGRIACGDLAEANEKRAVALPDIGVDTLPSTAGSDWNGGSRSALVASLLTTPRCSHDSTARLSRCGILHAATAIDLPGSFHGLHSSRHAAWFDRNGY